MNYMGPADGQGIVIYDDGQEVDADTQKYSNMAVPGEGMLVAEKMFIDLDDNYATFKLDELLFLNNILSEEELNAIYRL